MAAKEQALLSLRPGTEWSINGDSLSDIIWHTPDVTPVSESELVDEMQRLDAIAAAKAEADAVTRAAAIAHAKSLGFTDDMIAVMYPNLITEA